MFTVVVMRRILFLLVGLLLAACGETVVSGEDMARVDEPPIDAGPDADLEETATTVATEPEASTTTMAVAPTTTAPLPTGREALAAAQAAGEPVVLWFWGAH